MEIEFLSLLGYFKKFIIFHSELILGGFWTEKLKHSAEK